MLTSCSLSVCPIRVCPIACEIGRVLQKTPNRRPNGEETGAQCALSTHTCRPYDSVNPPTSHAATAASTQTEESTLPVPTAGASASQRPSQLHQTSLTTPRQSRAMHAAHAASSIATPAAATNSTACMPQTASRALQSSHSTPVTVHWRSATMHSAVSYTHLTLPTKA